MGGPMLSSLRAPLLIAFFAWASPALAQFRPIEIPTMPMVPAMPAPMPTYPSLTIPNLTTPNLAAPNLVAPTPALEPAAPVAAAPAEAPAAAVMVPGCPGRADCPPEPEGEGALKEFAKCAAEGKPFDQCLLDDPPPPTLAGLSDDERVQLTSCLGIK